MGAKSEVLAQQLEAKAREATATLEKLKEPEGNLLQLLQFSRPS